MKTAEPLLAAGLLCSTFAAGLCQFVMIGLIGLALFPVALALLVSAGGAAWAAGRSSRWRYGGLALYGVGVLLLLGVAGYASQLAYNHALSPRPGLTAPTGVQWTVLGLLALLPAVLIAVGLRHQSGWSWTRCGAWGVAVAGVVPAVVVLFFALAPVLALTA